MTNTHPFYIVYQVLTFEGTSYENFQDTYTTAYSKWSEKKNFRHRFFSFYWIHWTPQAPPLTPSFLINNSPGPKSKAWLKLKGWKVFSSMLPAELIQTHSYI